MSAKMSEVATGAGVDGAFVFQFVSQINPYDDNPKYDTDMASSSLVKSLAHGRRGTTYLDMMWEPKESFRAVADFYANTRLAEPNETAGAR
jgi:hypothetical protein